MPVLDIALVVLVRLPSARSCPAGSPRRGPVSAAAAPLSEEGCRPRARALQAGEPQSPAAAGGGAPAQGPAGKGAGEGAGEQVRGKKF